MRGGSLLGRPAECGYVETVPLQRIAMAAAEKLIRSYYDCFNRADWAGMLALLSDDVAHDINQGGREVGKDAFRRFLGRMEASYREEIVELVVLTETTGSHAATE